LFLDIFLTRLRLFLLTGLDIREVGVVEGKLPTLPLLKGKLGWKDIRNKGGWRKESRKTERWLL